MVASAEVVRARPSARARAELGLGAGARRCSSRGARRAGWRRRRGYCAGQGARIIDINFGCPAKKVTSGLSGSALMRDPDHALRLIEAVVGAVEVPVTVKMRLGWDASQLNAPEIAARAEAAGVRMITVHGRTRCQFYDGAADWAAIRRVKAAVRIPVIANGDIAGPDGRAAGAGALGRRRGDGRARRARPALAARRRSPRSWRAAGRRRRPRARRSPSSICGHYEAMLGFYGRDLGVRVARKHLGWYLDAFPGRRRCARGC